MSDSSRPFLRGGAAACSSSICGRVRPRPNRPALPRRRASRRVRPSQKERVVVSAAPLSVVRLPGPVRWLYDTLWRLIAVAKPLRDRIMTAHEFETTLRELLNKDPFQPFVVEYESGERIEVDGPHVAFAGGAASVQAADNEIYF